MFFFWGRGVVLLLFNLRVNCKAQVTAIMGTREFGCWVDNVYSAVSVYLMPKTANRNTLNCENSCFFSLFLLPKKKKRAKLSLVLKVKRRVARWLCQIAKVKKKRKKRGRQEDQWKQERSEGEKKKTDQASLSWHWKKKKKRALRQRSEARK